MKIRDERNINELNDERYFKALLPTSINHQKIKQKVIKMSDFAFYHVKSEIISNEGIIGVPALKHNEAKC